MESFRIEFVVDPLTPTEDGRGYHRAVSEVDPDALAARLVAVRFYHVSGGFCVVRDGIVWNAQSPAPYDRSRVECIVDRPADALMFVESVVGQAEDGGSLRAYFTEILTVEVRPEGPDTLTLAGATVSGGTRLRDISVPAAEFRKALAAASRDWLDFARRLLDALRSDSAGAQHAEVASLEARLALGHWEAVLARLDLAIEG